MYTLRYMLGVIFLCVIVTGSPLAQTTAIKPRILYGPCTTDSLTRTPFGEWFNPGYENYTPIATQLSLLQKEQLGNTRIRIFFGSWCGDSKRELPRFLKLLSAISFPPEKIELIAVGGNDSLVKQSPGHEEAGLGIFRVPTFIMYRNGTEIGRINEFPVHSLERDLYDILSGRPYTPNYRSFRLILDWLKDGTLLEDNNSIRGLSEQVRPLLAGEQELNSLAYLLLKQGKKKEALQVFRINYLLYPGSANTASSLGEGYYENGDYAKSVGLLEKSVAMNKDPEALPEILQLLYKAKAREK